MEIVGADSMTIEASQGTSYSDQGASCTDPTDGDLSESVTVHGATPILDTPGKYEVVYRCSNLNGLSAPALTREVFVVDSTCPTCTVRGSTTETIEASFPYVDEGATCVDSLDGVLSHVISSANEVDVEAVGDYVIEYRVEDAARNWNDGTTARLVGGTAPCTVAHRYFRTVHVVDTLKPVVSVYKGGTGELYQLGDAGPRSTAKNKHANPVRAFITDHLGTSEAMPEFASDRRRLIMSETPLHQQRASSVLALSVLGVGLVIAAVAVVRGSAQSPHVPVAV